MFNQTVVNGQLKDGRGFVVRALQKEDLTNMLTLQDQIMDHLDNQEQLQPLSVEEYDYIFYGNGEIIGAFVDERMIAFRALLIPDIDEEHLGFDAGLPVEEFPHVIYSEISLVHPEFRGNGLQTYLGRLLMDHIDVPPFHHVLTTVAPNNIPSLKDKFALGMEIVALTKKYGGKLRYTLYKNLQQSGTKQPVMDKVLIKNNEIEKQLNLLQEGYIGVALEQKDGKWLLRYEKRG